jgi:protein involved in polysaccharide export with SLBB domain
MRLISFLFLAVSASSVMPGASVAQASPGHSAGAVLRPGDAVQITVWRKPELSGEFVVAADSTLADPLYQDIKVAGLPVSNVTAIVLAFVAQYETNPRIRVEPLFRVSIGGEVRQPNMYNLRAETTVAQAVMLAGGASERGRLERVRLIRDDQEFRMDLTRPAPGLAQSPIRSGAQIFVGRRSSFVRDYVAPISSVVGATASILYLITR